MSEDPRERITVPLAAGGRVPPVGPPRTLVAAAELPHPPRRYSADSSVQRRPAPWLVAHWLRDVTHLQYSLCRRAAVALVRSLKHGQPCHPDWVKS